MRISIKNGRVIDPASKLDQVTDLHIAAGKVLAIGKAPEGFKAERVIDASNHVVCPGLIDIRTRLREPGQEYKTTIAKETLAAAHAGITTLVCPPDTDPIIDTPAVVELIHHRAEQAGHARVLTLGALTTGLEGKQLAEMYALKKAGCVGTSNALHPVKDTEVMRRAMEYAASHDITVHLHAEDPWLANGGCAHEGAVSIRLGLPGIPEAAETIAVARELQLIENTGAHAHFCQLSSERALRKFARARHEGLPITADVAIHYLFLTDMDIGYFNTQCHVRPPLRTQRDRDGLRKAVAEGEIDIICSDHQPHDDDAKLAPFPASEAGISGLGTLLPLTLRLVDEQVIDLSRAIAMLTQEPARLLGLLESGQGGSLSLGTRADICIFDPEQYWTLSPDTITSEGLNSPFMGWDLKGRVTHTLMAGKLTYGNAPH